MGETLPFLTGGQDAAFHVSQELAAQSQGQVSVMTHGAWRPCGFIPGASPCAVTRPQRAGLKLICLLRRMSSVELGWQCSGPTAVTAGGPCQSSTGSQRPGSSWA